MQIGDSKGETLKTGLIMVFLSCSPVLFANADWPMQGGNLESTFFSDAEVDPTDPGFGLLWRARIPGSSMSAPIVGDGKVFINMMTSSAIYAFDTADGALKWVAVDSNNYGSQDQTYSSAISYYQNHIYYRAHFAGTGNDGIRLVKANSSDGRRDWSVKLHMRGNTAPIQFYCDVGYGGRIYGISVTGNGDAPGDTMYCFARDTSDGRLVWTYVTGALRTTGYSRVTLDTNSSPKRLFFSCRTGHYYCLNLETGAEIWHQTHPAVPASYSLPYHHDTLYGAGTYDSGVVMLDANTGNKIGHLQNVARYKPIMGIGVHPDSNYIACRAGGSSAYVLAKQLVALGSSLNAQLGNPISTSSGCSQPLWLKGKNPVHDLGYFLFGNTKTSGANLVRGGGRLLCFSARKILQNDNANKLSWQFQTTSTGCAAPVAAGGRLYYLGGNGVLHCFGVSR